MRGYTFVKGYRGSFNSLAFQTFSINFEKWYELGFLKNKYDPYSLVDGKKVIANVLVNKIHMIIEGKRKMVQ
ncbi:MAG: hypothetical protein ACQEUT_02560 [Bacillota bacterium]